MNAALYSRAELQNGNYLDNTVLLQSVRFSVVLLSND